MERFHDAGIAMSVIPSVALQHMEKLGADAVVAEGRLVVTSVSRQLLACFLNCWCGIIPVRPDRWCCPMDMSLAAVLMWADIFRRAGTRFAVAKESNTQNFNDKILKAKDIDTLFSYSYLDTLVQCDQNKLATETVIS